MRKRISITLSDDLVLHLDALKLYYNYKSRSGVVEKALDELIHKHSLDIVFQYYLTGAREIQRDREGDQ